jgi:hypothetical protein
MISSENLTRLSEHNFKSASLKFSFIITTGIKGQKICLYKVFANGASLNYLSKSDRKFICYLNQNHDIAVSEALEKVKLGCIYLDLPEEKKKNRDIPQWKFLTFGKYRRTNVDDLPKIDMKYCTWLVEKYKMDIDRDIFGFGSQIKRYVISNEFKQIMQQNENDKSGN